MCYKLKKNIQKLGRNIEPFCRKYVLKTREYAGLWNFWAKFEICAKYKGGYTVLCIYPYMFHLSLDNVYINENFTWQYLDRWRGFRATHAPNSEGHNNEERWLTCGRSTALHHRQCRWAQTAGSKPHPPPPCFPPTGKRQTGSWESRHRRQTPSARPNARKSGPGRTWLRKLPGISPPAKANLWNGINPPGGKNLRTNRYPLANAFWPKMFVCITCVTNGDSG